MREKAIGCLDSAVVNVTTAASEASSLWLPREASLPADVAANDNVAAADAAASRHVLVDGVRDDGGGHGELHGRGVDDADDVARPGGLEHAEEGAIEAVLGVQVDDLARVRAGYRSMTWLGLGLGLGPNPTC